MTAKLILTAVEGNSLTPAMDVLRHEFPHIYQKLVSRISAESYPTPFGGSGAINFAKVAIDIDVAPEILEQLDPFFDLLCEIVALYTKQEINASIIIEQDGIGKEVKIRPKK